MINLDLLRSEIGKCRIAVIGDIMLDRYISGSVKRVSPEAPVPVLSVEAPQSDYLGGAANVAFNITTMGAQCTLISVVGQDDAGQIIKDKLAENGIDNHLITIEDYTTTLKTRFISDGHQLLRADAEEIVPDTHHDTLIDKALSVIDDHDIILFSDYNKGINQIAPKVIAAAKLAHKAVIVDPKINEYEIYQDAFLIKPNLRGFNNARDSQNGETITQDAKRLKQDFRIDNILLTKGGDGMQLFQSDDSCIYLPSKMLNVHDVTGAGDTVLAVLGVGLAAGYSLQDAAWLANQAAEIAVSHSGLYQASIIDLSAKLTDNIAL